jgi:hypothetical protein
MGWIKPKNHLTLLSLQKIPTKDSSLYLAPEKRMLEYGSGRRPVCRLMSQHLLQ